MKDDTISRQAAIQTAERMYKRCDTSSIEDYHDLIIEALTALPSAQQEYEHIPADDVALKSSSNVFKSPMWWFDVLKEIEKAGYVICRKMT